MAESTLVSMFLGFYVLQNYCFLRFFPKENLPFPFVGWAMQQTEKRMKRQGAPPPFAKEGKTGGGEKCAPCHAFYS
ncbi:MAG: hypothetical protein K6D55_10010 [Prevotella sp.]|nr:hypothetical protein [Prevotella sp.]